MVPKLLAFLITLLINVTVGVVIFFFMLLLAMNGYSESDASYGLGAYIVLAVLVSLAMSALAVVAVHILLKRKFRGWVSVLMSVTISSVMGAGLKIVCAFIGVLLAEFVRRHY